MDVKMAFLHGDLEEEVYMEQPEGMKEPSKEDWVCYMHKTLYGLMQAAWAWNLWLHYTMLGIGYMCTSADHCIYMHDTPTSASIMAIHIDDMCIVASSGAEMVKLKLELGKLFTLVDLGELTWLLGVTVTRDGCTRTVSLSQAAYIKSIAKHLHLEDAHPVTTPLYPHVILSKDLCPTSDEEVRCMKKIPYLTVVRSIMYAAIGMHPDLAFTVQHLSQFNCNPGHAHWTTAQHVVRYMYAMRHRALVLCGPDI